LIAGIDVGASATKGVLVEDLKIVNSYIVPTVDAVFSASEVMEYLTARAKGDSKDTIEAVAVSGGGSRKIGDRILDLPVKKVDEIKANGLGGLLLTEKSKGLIVNVGTGTSMVAAYDGGKNVEHVGGTGVGGGTILGLSKRLLRIDDFVVVEEKASRGDARMVDLTVGDIVGGPIGIVPAEATASNFGRLASEAAEDDVAAGIFNMVSQVIGLLAAMAAKAYNLEEDVILAGRVVRSRIVSENIRRTMELFGVEAYVPSNCEYCTAFGAACSVVLSEQSSIRFLYGRRKV